jgi:hypothetical protein
MDTHNDAGSASTAIYTSTVTTPVAQDFISTTFPPANYAIDNVDGDAYTWTRSPYGHNGAGSGKLSFYNAAGGTIDNLYCPKFDFANAITGAAITFELAHAEYSAVYQDRLQVGVSVDCGATWNTVYDKQGAPLQTTANYNTNTYNPVTADWRTETISLDQFIGNNELLVRFTGISGYGNNVYVDNINITDGTVSVPVTVFQSGVELYPNPASGEAHMNVNLSKASDLVVNLMNSVGAIAKTYNFKGVTNQDLKLDLTGLAKGTYVVNVISGSDVFNTRLNITE